MIKRIHRLITWAKAREEDRQARIVWEAFQSPYRVKIDAARRAHASVNAICEERKARLHAAMGLRNV